MERIDAYERQQSRRRTIAVLLSVICVVGAVFIFGRRPTDDPGKAGIPQRQAGPVTPVVEPAMPHAAPARSAVKQGGPAARPTVHEHPAPTVSAEDPATYIVVMIDGKEFHCPPDALRGSNSGQDQIEQVNNDGRPRNHPVQVQPRGTGRCQAVSPRE